jgi:hypothetical protein
MQEHHNEISENSLQLATQQSTQLQLSHDAAVAALKSYHYAALETLQLHHAAAISTVEEVAKSVGGLQEKVVSLTLADVKGTLLKSTGNIHEQS